MSLESKRVLVLIADKFQDEEGVEPVAFLRERGVEVVYSGLQPGTVHGKNNRREVEVEVSVNDVDPGEFDLLLLPGGAAPETLRLDDRVLELTRAFMELPDKIVAAICHGQQILISAHVLAGRTATCYAGIRDDLRFAGARYVDKPVCIEGRLITSRTPADLGAFNDAIADALGLAGEEKPDAGEVEATEVAATVAPEEETPEAPTPAGS